jgi:FKBP-type peptidyl-prolyl cis-trans isomerase SlyD
MTDTITVQNGLQVSMDYILTVEGEVIDASQEGQPLKFSAGKGQIIPGLEKALIGMAVGESKEVVVSPAEGYGNYNPQASTQVPRDRFPASIALEVGLMLQMRGPNGQPVPARVADISDTFVTMDFNHPLAGKTLSFKVTIAALSA